MRILAIRGQNLASLAQPFEIDLTAEPLAGTGLFAITGDTGAGKSTILDALCLALYGEYPRASGGRREKTLDASGEAIEATDPLNILRRGAGRGFAEVDFVGIDGARYRARWEVRRARGRATGKLQDAERKLERIDDGSGVAAGKRDVAAAVEVRTGLTFEQFRRTVLLAQGEFDAFLMAGETDRAELLEKITGTAVYSRISARVYDETADRRRSVEELERRLGEVAQLSGEERAALADEAEAVGARAAVLAAELGRIATAEMAGRDLARLAGEARAAVARAEAARTAGAIADRAATDAVAPVREAEQAWRSAAEAVTRFGPLWQEASRLDAALGAAQADLAKAEAAHADAERSAHEAACAAERLDAEAGRLAALADARASDMRQQSAHAPLAAEAKAITRAFAEARAATAAVASAATAIAQLDAERHDARQRSEAAGRVRAGRLEDRAAHATKLAEVRAELARMDPARITTHCAALDALVAALRDAWVVAGQRDAYERAAGTARAAVAEAATAATEAARARDVLRAALASAETARTSLQPMADLADAAAEQAAAHLRSVLADGAPCPVCGAREHPFAADESAAAALVASVRERRAALDAEIADLARRIGAAGEAHAAARGRERAETAAAEQAARDAAAAADRLASAGAAASASAATVGLDGFDLAPSAAQEAIAALGARAAAEQGAAVERRRRVEALRAAAEQHQRDVEAATAAAEAARAAMDADAEILVRADVARAAKEAAREEALRRREAALGEIAPHLAAAGLDAGEASRDAAALAAAVERVGALGAAYATLAAEQERLARAAADHRAQHAVAAARRDAAHETLEKSADKLAVCRRALADIEPRRAALLDGEATETHRARILAAADDARSALQSAKDALARADAEAGRCRALREAAEEAVADARRRSAEAAATATAALASLGGEGMAAAPTGEGGVDETAADDRLARLAQRRAAVEAEERSARDRLTEIRLRRADDEAAGQRRAALADDIARAREELRVWEDVNEAIGQRDGSKFRRFAQSVTLDQLVRIANAELDTLNPRYALRRGAAGDLTLDVVDRDMGDEVRTPRSLSGGERFLVALALALALSGLEGRHSFVDTLFIDEGFGSLDRDTLDVAIDALEALQGHGRKVGVITHVPAMIERIAVQVRVLKRGGGRSEVRIAGGGPAAGSD